MACNASKLPLIRAISARGYASAPSAAQASSPKAAGISSTTLSNKLFVAALDNGAPVARVTVAYRAGSRNEPSEEAGLSHFLRCTAGNGTANSTAFGIMRNLQQLGANLTATVDRETICYTLEATKDNIEGAVKFLNEVASMQIFQPWEFDEVVDRVRYEAAGLAPQVRALDLLHKGAFRRGLGNSLFCSPRQAGKISSESLQHFVANNFVAERCAVGVAGLSLDRAVAVAQTLSLPQGSSSQLTTPSPYRGGEFRKEMGGELAHVAVAAQGVSLCSPKEAIALSIMARALGNGPSAKWGTDNSPLAKAIACQLGDTPFAAKAFNIAYTDDGLFGVLISAPKCSAGKAVQAAAQVLMKASRVGGEAIKRGRAQLITEVLSAGDTTYSLAEDLAIQGLLTGAIAKASDLAQLISNVTDNDVTNVAGKFSKGKVSMGAVGNLVNVPYVDELQ